MSQYVNNVNLKQKSWQTSYKQDLLNTYKKIHSIFTAQQKTIQYAYEQFSDFENAAYKQKLLKSYNTIHSIHKNQQKAIQYAYEQFSDFDAVYKQKLLKSYNTIHSIFVNQQKHIQSALKYFNAEAQLHLRTSRLKYISLPSHNKKGQHTPTPTQRAHSTLH